MASRADSESLARNLHETQRGMCFICGDPVDMGMQDYDIDHIEPLATGGRDDPQNKALTHAPCNKSKQASHLGVARALAAFDKIAAGISDDRAPNLGDVLLHYGGAQHDLRASANDDVLRVSLPDRTAMMTVPILTDALCGFRSAFVELPIQYLHHDDAINPRALNNLRGLVEEFHRKIPQLHVALGWIDTSSDGTHVKVFDGQHKAAAQVLLGARSLPVRVFIDPDTRVLLTANTNAGTKLKQVAFPLSVQRRLGSSILRRRIDQFCDDKALDPDGLDWSEQDLVKHFAGDSRAMRRYVVDSVRHQITDHPDNKLRHYIEHAGGKSANSPWSYTTVERTFYSLFVSTDILATPYNHTGDDGSNPRLLEVEQTVRLMNIVAEAVFVGHFDVDHGVWRIERRVLNGEPIPDGHLRAWRMSRPEVAYNWLSYVWRVVFQHFVVAGGKANRGALFQRAVPELCWRQVERFIHALAGMPLWVNRELSATAFGAKRNYAYWEAVFDTGIATDATRIMSDGLDLTTMIQDAQ